MEIVPQKVCVTEFKIDGVPASYSVMQALTPESVSWDQIQNMDGQLSIIDLKYADLETVAPLLYASDPTVLMATAEAIGCTAAINKVDICLIQLGIKAFVFLNTLSTEDGDYQFVTTLSRGHNHTDLGKANKREFRELTEFHNRLETLKPSMQENFRDRYNVAHPLVSGSMRTDIDGKHRSFPFYTAEVIQAGELKVGYLADGKRAYPYLAYALSMDYDTAIEFNEEKRLRFERAYADGDYDSLNNNAKKELFDMLEMIAFIYIASGNKFPLDFNFIRGDVMGILNVEEGLRQVWFISTGEGMFQYADDKKGFETADDRWIRRMREISQPVNDPSMSYKFAIPLFRGVGDEVFHSLLSHMRKIFGIS
jgi:hypothetical protein